MKICVPGLDLIGAAGPSSSIIVGRFFSLRPAVAVREL